MITQKVKGGDMKYLTTIIAIAMLSIISISMASAAVAVVSPTTGTYKSGTFLINCSYENGTDVTDPTAFAAGNSSAFFNNSAGTTMFSTWTGSPTCSVNACWGTITTADIADGTGDIRCSLGNSTSKWYANATVNNIILDDTNPSLDVKESTLETTKPINYKCSDTNIATFTLVHKNAAGTNVTETLQKSTSDYVTILTTVADTYRFTCTDSAGNSATDSVVVSDPTGYAQPSAEAIQPNSGNFFTKEIFNIGTFAVQMWMLLVIVGLAVWYYSK